MMRYFLHIGGHGRTVLDEEGNIFATLDDAKSGALEAVRELASAPIKSGLVIEDDYLDLRDEAGKLVFSLSFCDVVRQQIRW